MEINETGIYFPMPPVYAVMKYRQPSETARQPLPNYPKAMDDTL